MDSHELNRTPHLIIQIPPRKGPPSTKYRRSGVAWPGSIKKLAQCCLVYGETYHKKTGKSRGKREKTETWCEIVFWQTRFPVTLSPRSCFCKKARGRSIWSSPARFFAEFTLERTCPERPVVSKVEPSRRGEILRRPSVSNNPFAKPGVAKKQCGQGVTAQS